MVKSNATVAVVGLGYVGLPLALLSAEKGYKVIGFDINTSLVADLKKGVTRVDGITKQTLKSSTAIFTDNADELDKADISIICVPTPLVENSQLPDLAPVRGAVRTIAPHLHKGSLVILESTVNPGVCDEIVIPMLESSTDLTIGKDVEIAYCPERINPGDPSWHVGNINRVIGGNTENALKKAYAFYSSIIDAEIKKMGSIKEAEAVKVVENSFRDINIAFVNELAMSFHHMGIDIESVIDGAATKPFAFMAHRPGCGVGGHCIPVDPYYLIDYAKGHGFDHDLLRMARRTNERMPAFTVDLLKESLEKVRMPLNGTKVALLGVSYKPNVGDQRESPSHKIHEQLQKRGADVVRFDPHLAAQSDVETLEKALEHAEAIVIATAHKAFEGLLHPDELKKYGIKVVVDGRNMLKHLRPEFAKAGIVYQGIGIA
jgi:UDP-N-acetyl-D-glucosamine dehydrogenase